VIARNPAAAWKRIKGKVEQVSDFTADEYNKIADGAKKNGSQKLYLLIRVMRYGGLGIIDAALVVRTGKIGPPRNERVNTLTDQ